MAEPSARMGKLLSMLQKQPNDTFLLYGLAMEYKKADDAPSALSHLDRVLALDPGYCYAYHQKGLIYESQDDLESARRSYREGIAAATTKGDAHARDEIAAALQMIEG